MPTRRKKANGVTVHADRIEMLEVSALKPYGKNARKHPDAQIKSLVATIRKSGFTVPLIVDDENGLIAGHGRLVAAKQIGMRQVPCVRAKGLTEPQIRALRLADNQIALGSEWDFDLLRAELGEIHNLGFDLSDLGFSNLDLSNIGVPGFTEDERIAKAEETPEPPAVPVVKRGELWLLGEHRVLCGDATSATDVGNLLGGAKPHLMVTDPPYGINIVKVAGASDGGSKPVTIRTGTIRAHGASPFGGVKKMTATVGGCKLVDANEYYPIIGDDKPFDPAHLIGMAERHILFGGNYFASRLPDGRCWLVWDKNNTGHFADCELAWTDCDHGVKLYRYTWNGLVREGNRAEELTKRVHPTQKPVGLFKQIIEDFSKARGHIVDLYVGAGTTLIASEVTGRICSAMEISPAYSQLTIERWQNFTGKIAKREDGATLAELKEDGADAKIAAERLASIKANPESLVHAPDI